MCRQSHRHFYMVSIYLFLDKWVNEYWLNFLFQHKTLNYLKIFALSWIGRGGLCAIFFFFTDSRIISKIRFFMYLNVKFSLFVLIFQMSLPRPSGLKAPTKIGRPTGLPQPRSAGTGIPTPGSVHKAQSKPPHFVVVLFFTMSPAGEVICDLSVIMDYHRYYNHWMILSMRK